MEYNSEKKMFLNGDVHMHRKDNKELIIFSSIPEWFIGEVGIYDAIRSFEGKSLLDIDEDNTKELFKTLQEMELLVSDNELVKEKVEKDIEPVNGMWINVDSNCNLRCKHCFIGETLNTTKDKLTVDDYKTLAADLQELSTGNLRVVIAGGEPLLRKDILEIIECFNIKGLHPNVITNGLLLSKEIISYLAKNQIETTISLDGVTKEMHEFLRGKNTYDITLEKIEECRKAKVPLILSMTVHKDNQDSLFKYFELAETVGAKRVILNFLNCIGNAKTNGLIPADEFDIIYKLLEQASNNDSIKDRLMNTAISKLIETVLYPIRTDCCGSGINNCSILANGDVSPCPSFQGTDFCGGNIRERSLVDIWNDPNTFKLHRSVDITTLNPICEKCEVRLFCGGGCRARAYDASNGDINARSPHCKEYKKLYIALMWFLEENPNLRELRTSQSDQILKENYFE